MKWITGKYMNPNYYRIGAFDLQVYKLRSGGRQLVFRLRTPELNKKITILKIIRSNSDIMTF